MSLSRRQQKAALRQKKKDEKRSRSRLSEMLSVLKKHGIFSGMTPEKLCLILEDLGPTYIKIGQILSTRPDLLPEEYCKELMTLQTDVPPMPFSTVKRLIEESYGHSISDVFSFIDEKPIGSASIAQAHYATLVTGEPVVVKVQRENIYDVMKRDIEFLHKLFHRLPVGLLKSSWDPEMVLDELWAATQAEMDFENEAKNLERFAKLQENVRFVDCPKLYKEYSTATILVMEHVDGISLFDVDALKEAGYDTEEICRKMVDNFIKQVMEDGFFHGDPHPGNLLIRDGKICWLDMGMMGTLNEHDRKEIKLAIGGIAERDVLMIESAVMSMGDFTVRPDRKRLRTDIEDMLMKYGSIDVGKIDLAVFMKELLSIMKENQVKMPRGMTLLARGLAHIEGVAAKLSPGLNVLEVAKARTKASLFTKASIEEYLKQFAGNVIRGASDLAELPTDLKEILEDYNRNQTPLRLDLHASEDLSEMVMKNINHLILGLWVLGLLVGSSIVCTTDMRPQILDIPALGFFGFLGAIGIAVYIAIVYLINRHRSRKHKKHHLK